MELNQINPKNIIVRMPNWLGDLVMATPVLADIKKKWPQAKLTAMCQSNVAAVLKHDPHIDDIMSFKRVSGWIPHLKHGEVIEKLRYGKFDLGILLTNSFSSAWWFWLGRVKNRIGYADHFRSLLLNKALPFPKDVETRHLVETYKLLLAPFGVHLSNSAPRLYLTHDEMNHANTTLSMQGITVGQDVIVGINPGAAFGSAKCWLPERFQAVAKKLIANPKVRVVFYGDPAGAPLVNEICKDLPPQVVNLAGKTSLRELIALINSCSIFLTNDSGPMHIAAALKIPLVALFGSTSDVKTGPYGIGKVIHKHVECSPCYKRVCPIDFRCMKRIEVEEVYRELQKMLEEGE